MAKAKVVRKVPQTKAQAELMDQGEGKGFGLTSKIRNAAEPLPDLGDGITGSEEQVRIWQEMVYGTSNMIVKAFAGTGKTFTKIRGLSVMVITNKLPKYTNVAAFNRAVGLELKDKVPQGVRAGTIHSFGFSACRYVNQGVEVEQDKMDLLLTDIMGEKLNKEDRELYYQVLKIASLCKNTLAGEVWQEDGEWYFEVVNEVLDELCGKFDIIVDDRNKAYALVTELLTASLRDEEYIDQDDMIWLPVVKDYRVFRANLLIVDEGQDLNACQQAYVMKAGDRIMLVGDKFQAIYGFRGADAHSIDTMAGLLDKTRRGLVELSLTKTRRCPKSHVKYVKDKLRDIAWMQPLQKFEALDDAPEGSINVKSYETLCREVVVRNMVVCRTNAPLVALAFECIRQRKRVKIQGRDIGAGFKKLIELHSRGKDSITVLRENIELWHHEQITKINRTKGHAKKDRMISQQQDRVMALRYFMNNSKTVTEIKRMIDELFSETTGNKDFVLLGTAHALKGMEAETVWVLGPEEMPHPMAKTDEEIEQEWNLWYVAHTRSKDVMNLTRLPERENVGRSFREE